MGEEKEEIVVSELKARPKQIKFCNEILKDGYHLREIKIIDGFATLMMEKKPDSRDAPGSEGASKLPTNDRPIVHPRPRPEPVMMSSSSWVSFKAQQDLIAEMLAVLKEVEFTNSPDSDLRWAFCPECKVMMLEGTFPGHHHLPTCRLAAVIKKAEEVMG